MYHATKWGIEGFCEALAQEIEPFGIRTILVEPGMIRTGFYDAATRMPASEAYRGGPADREPIPLDRMAVGVPAPALRRAATGCGTAGRVRRACPADGRRRGGGRPGRGAAGAVSPDVAAGAGGGPVGAAAPGHGPACSGTGCGSARCSPPAMLLPGGVKCGFRWPSCRRGRRRVRSRRRLRARAETRPPPLTGRGRPASSRRSSLPPCGRRAALRERVHVEHALAHVGRWQALRPLPRRTQEPVRSPARRCGPQPPRHRPPARHRQLPSSRLTAT